MKAFFPNHKLILFVLGALLLVNTCLGQAPIEGLQWNIEQLSVEDGLPQNSINCLVQDKQGFMWFGTKDGLAKFDGLNFEIFRASRTTPNSLPGNHISCLLSSHDGKIFIGTAQRGLSIYDPISEQITRLEDENLGIKRVGIVDLLEDAQNRIWVGTQEGLCLLTPIENKPGKYTARWFLEKIPSEPVKDLIIDAAGNIWVLYWGGIFCLRYESEALSIKATHPIGGGEFLVDSKNNLWLTREDSIAGIWKYERNLQEFQPFETDHSISEVICLAELSPGQLLVGIPDPLNPLHLVSLSLDTDKGRVQPIKLSQNIFTGSLKIYRSKENVLWIATNGLGVFRFHSKYNRFFSYLNSPDLPESLKPANKSVRSVCELPGQQVLIGGYEKTLIYSHLDKRFHKTAWKTSLNQVLYSIYPDPDDKNQIWLGGEMNGLFNLDLSTQKLTPYCTSPEANPHCAPSQTITALQKEGKKHLWIGSTAGLARLDLSQNIFQYFGPKSQPSLPAEIITSLYVDQNGLLWIGTEDNGLWGYAPEQNKFFQFPLQANLDRQNERPLPILCIQESKVGPAQGSYWLGTAGSGMIKMSFQENGGSLASMPKFSEMELAYYTTQQGLPNNTVYGILEDSLGNLWLSTNEGIGRFQPEKEKFINFEQSDGLQGQEFNRNAYFKGANGRMYFGGIYGLNSFKPESFVFDTIPPVPIIKDIKIANQSLVLDSAISQKKSFVFSHKSRGLTLEFMSLGYVNPASNDFLYQLGSKNDKWIPLGQKNELNLYKLPTGKTLLKVKACNSDGFCQQRAFAISVTLPLWQKNWFQLLLLLVGTGLIYGLYRWRIQFLLKQRSKLRQKVQHITADIIAQNEKLEMQSASLEEANNKIKAINDRLAEEVYRQTTSLRESEQRLSSILRNLPGMVYRVKFDGKYSPLFVSEGVTELLHLSVEEVMEKGITGTQMIPEEFHEELFLESKKAIEDGKIHQTIFPFKVDGKYKWVHNRFYFTGEYVDGYPVTDGLIIDINEQKKAELILQEREKLLSLVFNGTQEYLGLVKVDGQAFKLESLNENFLKAFRSMGLQTDPDYLKGMDFDLFLQRFFNYNEKDIALRHGYLEKVRSEGKSIKFEETIKLKNKRFLFMETQVIPIKDKGESCSHILYLSRDITQKKLEDDRIISAIVETEDRERTRIAKELHDSLGQTLTSTAMNFQLLQKSLPDDLEAHRIAKIISGNLLTAIEESRSIAYNLMPKTINDFGFVLALEGLLEGLRAATDITFYFHHNLKDQRIEKRKERSLFRIVQVALDNIIKHADASTTTIQLNKYEDGISLTIEDDGRGFDKNELTNKGNTIGLNSIKTRVYSLSGNIEIESAKGMGTLIHVEIPL